MGNSRKSSSSFLKEEPSCPQVGVSGTEAQACSSPLWCGQGDKDHDAGRPRGARLQQTQTNRQTQTVRGLPREAAGQGLLLLAIPAPTHGLYHGPVELAPGGPCGWCEGGAEALLQHVQQGLTHRLQRQGALSFPMQEGTAPSTSGKTGGGDWPFLLSCTGPCFLSRILPQSLGTP